MTNDPEYVAVLEAMPEKQRRALLEGDWNVFEGQFFEEFDEKIHVFDKNVIQIQEHWRKYRARDYGLDMTDCLWAALDEDGTMWVYKELSRSGLTVSQSGNMINSMTLPNERPYVDICPPDMWNRQSQTGRSAIEILMKECGQYPIKANNDRINGWLFVKEMLQVSPITGRPRLMIDKSCTALIHSLKIIQHDERNVNDVANTPHSLTHSVDAVRYLCTSYTYTPDRIQQAKAECPYTFARYALNLGEYENRQEENNATEYYGSGADTESWY